MASAPQTSFATLQAGRAIAAIAVVGLHAERTYSDFVGDLPSALSTFLRFGYLGVDFFFVLSGFIIYLTNAPGADRPGWSRAYATSRLTRIYIPYLPVGIAMACFYTFLPGISLREQGWSWFSSLTLFPWAPRPALGVAWTLQYEILFYFLAWLMLRTGRVREIVLLWAALVAGALLLGAAHGPLLGRLNLEFLFGMAAAWCFMQDRLPGAKILLLAGFSFILLFFLLGGERGLSILFGLGLAFLVAVAVKAEAGGQFTAVASPLLLLGNASYAIYLVHGPILSLAGRVAAHAGLHWAAIMPLLFAAPILAGLAYHLWFELPALSAARRALAGKPAERTARPDAREPRA